MKGLLVSILILLSTGGETHACSGVRECLHCIRMKCFWISNECFLTPNGIHPDIIPPGGSCPVSTTTVTPLTSTIAPPQSRHANVFTIAFLSVATFLGCLLCIWGVMKRRRFFFNHVRVQEDMPSLHNPMYDPVLAEERVNEAIELGHILTSRGSGT